MARASHCRLPAREEIVLRMLEQAAEAGQECPSNATLVGAIGAASLSTPVQVMHCLEARGLITVKRNRRWRVVTITATGATTVPPAWAADSRMDDLAELVAEGMLFGPAAEAMDLSISQVGKLWKQIKAGLGPQAV